MRDLAGVGERSGVVCDNDDDNDSSVIQTVRFASQRAALRRQRRAALLCSQNRWRAPLTYRWQAVRLAVSLILNFTDPLTVDLLPQWVCYIYKREQLNSQHDAYVNGDLEQDEGNDEEAFLLCGWCDTWNGPTTQTQL